MVATFKEYLAETARFLNVEKIDYTNRAELSERIGKISLPLMANRLKADRLIVNTYANILKDRPEGDSGRLIKAFYDLSVDEPLDYQDFLGYAGLKKNARSKLYSFKAIGVADLNGDIVQPYPDKILWCWPEVSTFEPAYDLNRVLKNMGGDWPKKANNLLAFFEVGSIDELSIENLQGVSTKELKIHKIDITSEQLHVLTELIIRSKNPNSP